MCSTPLAAQVGTLKGFDQLVNLVLDECVEYLRGEAARARWPVCAACLCPNPHPGRCPADPADPYRITEESRTLGVVVCRGTNVTVRPPRPL